MSELVFGFNVEFGGGVLAFIFVEGDGAEYTVILFMKFLFCVTCWGAAIFILSSFMLGCLLCLSVSVVLTCIRSRT